MPRANKHKSKRISPERSASRRESRRLNFNLFNLLENILVCCSVESLGAPKESGVQFRLERSKEGVYLLFQIDRGFDPLIPDTQIKCDYLSVFANRNRLILTFVEMKGKGEKDAAHGVDQILHTIEVIKREIGVHLPGRLRVTYQGVLLTPYNSQVPLQKMAEAWRRKRIVIKAVQYNHSANLGDYVSTQLEVGGATFSVTPTRAGRGPNMIETLLGSMAMDARKEDSLFELHFKKTSDRTGVYVNYEETDRPNYFSLIAHSDDYMVHLNSICSKCKNELRREFDALGLSLEKLISAERS